jgi:hypothetical protein
MRRYSLLKRLDQLELEEERLQIGLPRLVASFFKDVQLFNFGSSAAKNADFC